MSKALSAVRNLRPAGNARRAPACASLGAASPLVRREPRVNLDPEGLKNGLAQLVLTLVKLLHELLENQAIRRIESGSLDDASCERIGLTLMRQSEQIEKLREAFGLAEKDLNIDLGPLGTLV